MLSETGPLVLPQASRNQAYTVRVPSPAGSVKVLVVAYASHVLQLGVALRHMPVTSLASLAESVRLKLVERVVAASPLITTLPLGASSSGAGRATRVLPAERLPA